MARAEPRRLVHGDRTCPRNGARQGRTSPGPSPSAAARRRSFSATASTCRRSRPTSIATTQERLVAMDADTGNVVWERRVNDFHSDVRYDRAGWASPAVDPATGIIYMFTGAAQLLAFSPDGKVLWDRSLPEEYGAITTHGGRTTSPIVEGDKVILNTLIQNWGPDLGRPGNRYFAFDKAHRPDDLGELAAGAALRHELLDADRRRRQRRAPDDRRRHRWRVSRASGEHGQAGVEFRGQQARDPEQRAVPRQHGVPHARRREHRHHRDGHDRGDRRHRQRRGDESRR